MTAPHLALNNQPQGISRLFTLRTLQLVLIAAGIFVSGYLTYVKATGVAMACVQGSAFNCDRVQNSAYSEMFGIPIAYMGLAMYLVLGAVILLEQRVGLFAEQGQLIVLGISVVGWIFSMYLVYIQFFVLEALCPWCLAHEAIFTVFFGATILRYLRTQQAAD
jgi:uncharacterized membrane protein